MARRHVHVRAAKPHGGRARGERFSLREFHRAVLHPGALPLPDLAFHIGHVIAAEPAAA